MSPEVQCAFPLTCGSFFWKHNPLNLSNTHFKPACNRNKSLAVTATGYCEVCVSDFVVVVWGIGVVENSLCSDIKKKVPRSEGIHGGTWQEAYRPAMGCQFRRNPWKQKNQDPPEFKMVVPTAWLGHGIFVNRLQNRDGSRNNVIYTTFSVWWAGIWTKINIQRWLLDGQRLTDQPKISNCSGSGTHICTARSLSGNCEAICPWAFPFRFSRMDNDLIWALISLAIG